MNKIHWFALGWMLFSCGGCTTNHQNSNGSNLYVVTVSFVSTGEKLLEKLEITTRPDVAFAVQSQDPAGNHYQVQGTLRQKSKHSFRLEGIEINSPGMSSSASSFDLELGQGQGWRGVDGIVLGGYDLKLTKK
jgi:hypothetical protein